MRSSLSLSLLRTSLLGAMGLSSVAGCGGVVVDNGSGGSGTSGGVGTTVGQGSVTAGTTVTSTKASTGSGNQLCAGAQPILLQGKDSGYVRCGDGAIDRVAQVACDVTANLNACVGNENLLNCKVDSDCNAQPNGHCQHRDNASLGGTSCDCAYSCSTDADCAQGAVCACAGLAKGLGISQCVSDDCHVGNDCPSGECGLSSYDNGCSQVVAVACRSTADTCRSDAACPTPGCAPEMVGMPYACQTPHCATGRPLVVEGVSRTAEARARDDWRREPEPASDLDPARRSALAGHYEMVAALEHASIGSFARFTLQLLALGAPAELLVDAQRAALDEIEHARLAYGLASAYGGAPVGPAVLPEAVYAIETDRAAIVRGLVIEGCVGETLGAAEALAAAGDALPEIAAIHRRIAADEERHAALAWRTLRWLVDGDRALAEVARDAFREAAKQFAIDPEGSALDLRAHGALPPSEIGALRRHCHVEVIDPCARAVLA